MEKCANCGTEAPIGRKFCSTCGSPLTDTAPSTEDSKAPEPAPTSAVVSPPSASPSGPLPTNATTDTAPHKEGRRRGVALAVTAFVVGGLLVGALVWFFAARINTGASTDALPASPADSVTAEPVTPSLTPEPSSALEPTNQPTETAVPNSSPESTASDRTQSGTPEPSVRVLPGITDVEFEPDYVVLREYELFPDGSAILSYDRLSPGQRPKAGKSCRVLRWDSGERCASNVTRKVRTVGVIPGSFIVTPTGHLELVNAFMLDAIVSPSFQPLDTSVIVALVVNSAGLVDEIRIAKETFS